MPTALEPAPAVPAQPRQPGAPAAPRQPRVPAQPRQVGMPAAERSGADTGHHRLGLTFILNRSLMG
jgi:hypothetical protein